MTDPTSQPDSEPGAPVPAGLTVLSGPSAVGEWARYASNYYGTPRGPVGERLRSGVPVLLEVDVVGARQVRAAVPGALLVFLAPPSWGELVRRLTSRGTESAEVMEQRLEAARAELRAESEFDISLVNTSVEDVCAQLVSLMTAQPACLPAD